MSDDASNTAQIQQCLDDINGADVQARKKGLDALAPLLLARTRPWVSRVLHGCFPPSFGNKVWTDDLHQGTIVRFLKAVEAGRCPKTVDDLDGLVKWHLRNEAEDKRRFLHGKKGSKRPKEKQPPNNSDPSPVEQFADPATGPATAAVLGEVWELVDKLEETQRSVYKLSRQDKTLAEIAEILGMTVSQAKEHLRAAKSRIGEMML